MYVSRYMAHWTLQCVADVCMIVSLNFVTAWAEKRRYHTSRAARLDTYRAGQITSHYRSTIYISCTVHACTLYVLCVAMQQ